MLLRTKTTILLLFITLLSNAQFLEFGKPFIDNYSSKDYHRENQNYSVVQDTNGFMYIGNLNGIMKFDGQLWTSIKLTGTPQLCKTKKGIIFVGAYKTFGIINTDKKGKMIYQDLSESVKNAGFEFKKVKQMIGIGNKVIVNAAPYIFAIDSLLNVEYIYGGKNRSIKIIKSKTPLILLKDSILKIDTNNFELTKVKLKKDSDIKNIFPWFDSYLIQFKSGNWKIFDQNFKEVSTLNDKNKTILNKLKIDFGYNFSRKHFLFGTNNCGIIILDSSSNIISQIKQTNGLADNDINAAYKDSNENIWLALNNGLSVLEFPSSFSIFNNSYGVLGTITDIIKHNNRLYVSSTQGLFVSPKENISEDCEIPQFIKIEGIGQLCTNFLKVKNRLLVTNALGIYEIQEETASKISDLMVYELIPSHYYPNIIFAATHQGVSVLEFYNDNILREYSISGFNKKVGTISETKDGNLWLGTEYEGLYYFDLHAAPHKKPTIKQYKESNGLPKDHGWIDVFYTRKNTYFSTGRGLFLFNKNNDTFNQVLLADSLKNRWYSPIKEDQNGNIWFSSGENTNYTNLTGINFYIPNRDSSIIITKPFNPIRDYSIESFFIDDQGTAWLGSNKGVLRFDTRNILKKYKPSETTISKIIFGKDSVISPEQFKSKIPIKLPYKNNSIQIYASNNNYKTHDLTQFQFWLEGHEPIWNNWKDYNTEQYTGLKEGKYTLHIRSKNIYDQISKPVSFTFRILPPYYRSIWAYIMYTAISILFIYIILQYRSYLYQKEKYALEKIIREKTEEIITQKERAEDLVKSILPEDGKLGLKNSNRISRQKYELATVLFSDVQGFTRIAQNMQPETLLDELDEYVMAFDNIVGKYGIEKIKTIGDAYMCAGGIPNKNKTNPIDVVLAGLQMLNYTRKLQKKSDNYWGVRFGIHTGPIIAGVVGTRKLSYDIWGDTVNIASRMESYGEVGELNISHSTHELVSAYFECDFRGTIPIKYKGNTKMYFVRGLKFEYAADYERITPNKKFLLKMQFIRFNDLEDLILTKLEKGLDSRLYYHNVKHTIDVVNMVEIIGMGEGIEEEEMLLLKTAALFHDLGHTISFIDHEEQGIVFAKEILPQFYYSEKQIEIISELIFATKFPPEPKNKLEEIICDADLDYLGRSDFIHSSHNLYLEMYEHGRIKSIKEWNKIQVSFLKSHHYYTETARNARQVNKMEQLRLIEAEVKKNKDKL